jgi:hypothetical protein
MGIELPPELADVAAETGVKWPAADEDKMREAAQAWRDSGQKLTTLISDADSSAQTALNTTEGAGADAARKHWGTYVKPDTGHLTAAARGCTTAADQLDHAANQVGEAKLAIVRNLVPLAKNKDVAQHAAAAGHPTALLGLDTAVKGTAANVANVHHTLVTAVQPAAGVVVDATQNVVDPTPGVHDKGQQPGLLQATGNVVQDVTGGGQQPGGGQHQGLVPGATHLVSDVAHGAGNVVSDVVQPGGHGHDPGLLPATANATGNLVGDVAGPGGPHGLPGGPDHMPVGDGGQGPLPGGHFAEPGNGGMIAEPSTGPIPVQGHPGMALSHDAPTPPAGFPIVHDQGVHAAAAAPAVLDAPPPTQAPPLGSGGPNPVAGGSPFGGGPSAPFGGGPSAPPPPGGQLGGPMVNQPIGGQPAPGGPHQQGPGPAGPVPAQRGQAPMVVPGDPARQAATAEPGRNAAVGDPSRQPPTAAALSLASGSQKPEQDTVLALWLVRLFPIGHMPVATSRPARQLPPPRPEFDYAPGMRFEPHDHPQSDLIDDSETRSVEPSPPDEDAVVDGLAIGYDSLGGQNERDWDRRFVVRPGSGRDTLDIEYAWPPSEIFPEGATAPGEPEVLEPGTVIDRFGTPEGRVFAADATAFDRRSLPPSHLRAGYRRYRVVRPLPVWRGLSAAWFAQPGGGVRYRTVYPATDLVALGYLTEENVDEG